MLQSLTSLLPPPLSQSSQFSLGERDLQLTDAWQRRFPLAHWPFAVIAGELDMAEDEVIERLRRLKTMGVLSRVGATVRPHAAGASTLAAMSVPRLRLKSVADAVSAERGVNHNYERDHEINLWFVLTGRNWNAVDAALARITAKTGIAPIKLPLERMYHVDLGFCLNGSQAGAARSRIRGQSLTLNGPLSDCERCVLHAIEDGLPLQQRPYAVLARRCDMAEGRILRTIAALIESCVITRFGLIVRHRALGYTSNAMAVWDIDDDKADRIGGLLAAEPFVTLCYRRRRHESWPYNLYCMVHGRDKSTVHNQIARLNGKIIYRGDAIPARHAVLFSTKCFKQRGARYSTGRGE